MSIIETKQSKNQTKTPKITVNYGAKINLILLKIDKVTVENVLNSQEELHKKSIINHFKSKIIDCGIPTKELAKSEFSSKIESLIDLIIEEKNNQQLENQIDSAINNLQF